LEDGFGAGSIQQKLLSSLCPAQPIGKGEHLLGAAHTIARAVKQALQAEYTLGKSSQIFVYTA